MQTLELMVGHLCKHVLPTLHPRMFDVKYGGMGKGELRDFFFELRQSVRAMFADARYESLGRSEAARVESDARARGVDDVHARQHGLAAGRAVVEERRAQTSTPYTRVQATEADMCLVRDVLVSEQLRVNRALVGDAFMATVELCGERPSSAGVGTEEEELSFWYQKAPLTNRDWYVNTVGVGGNAGVMLDGGEGAKLTIDVTLEKGKKRGDREVRAGAEHYRMTPNAQRMVHLATVRFLRLQLKRGVFKGCYSRLAEDAAVVLRAKVQAKGFIGIVPQQAGFESFEHMADACHPLWAKDAMALDWPTFPAVDEVSGAFIQSMGEDKGVLANSVIGAGAQLGFDDAWGTWSVRKKAAAEVHSRYGGEQCSMFLGHAEGSSRGAYVRGGGHDVDVGAISMGRKASVVHDEGYAAWRVPRSCVRRFCEVDSSTDLYLSSFVDNKARIASRKAVTK
mmetsp:Transcript_36562/g.100892  ORF Transcript_36562/g.100892 Transcript_36562/m.100892 type:complete len:453 (+) Transcript_36562:146-1504(+)